jgi:hypothetical protein
MKTVMVAQLEEQRRIADDEAKETQSQTLFPISSINGPVHKMFTITKL